eukprot:GILK01007470.1.p1 GENE.GILK01007470.1~~GILK01007470.1.p1  ORF type:complete len:508 (+),score=79.30 GILK01007470.1:145-1668(+)
MSTILPTNDNESWSPSSWRSKPIQQQPEYADESAVDAAIAEVSRLPPLVHPGEVDSLKRLLAEAAQGKRFLLQGGDCAERFADCNQSAIESKLKIMLQMSLTLMWGGRVPTVRIARMAGQYAKPRSKPTEIVDGVEVASFKGDNVNGFEPNNRTPDPQRLVRAYFHSAATLNYVRAALDGGFADLHRPHEWDLDFIHDAAKRQDYEKMTEHLQDAMEFMSACGINSSTTPSLKSVDLYSSHEGLLLPYEEALTREVRSKHYNLGAHFLWIGDRTRQLDGAHIEYFRGITNPIGVKVGPSSNPANVVALIQRLNPSNELGKITIITRLGADKVGELLPPFVEAIKTNNLGVLWCSDPMHGNTYTSEDGIKTRHFDQIVKEVLSTASVLRHHGCHLGGVHFEMTGENVTECVGGPQNLSEKDLSLQYTTYCDPRLNYHQSMEVAFLLAGELKKQRKEKEANIRKRKKSADLNGDGLSECASPFISMPTTPPTPLETDIKRRKLQANQPQ